LRDDAAMIQVIALPGGERFARELALLLGCRAATLEVHRFPDGECRVRLPLPVAGDTVVFAGSLSGPDAKTLPLIFAADAARELGAARIALAAPYLAYMRQDARFHEGEAVSARSYGRMLSSSIDLLVTVDAHLHRIADLSEVYAVPARNVAAAPAVAQWLRANVQAPLVVGPDSESRQWVEHVASLARAPFTVLEKVRRGDRDVSVTGGNSSLQLDDAAAWSGFTPVLMDDIVSTGHTVIAAARALGAMGLSAPQCVAVHALFDAAAEQAMRGAGIARIASCDTVPHATNAIGVAPLVAQAIREMTGG
jgi:ribose-phosphate pyrophosphokinase